ncbi:hypothetical protein ADH76_13585 [Enterocloster clostridioformis]|uniref:hypothetical protein n=1 Tax=Enterocloster clostridioformis TaxID=1531 RepID=UPI00080C4D9A|nr:hypothetical protein [Enterocloster clostridioformis]ANU47920.1 hypothetical protein A4V08_21070 [Lachnoclostridium sp. YL32]NDO29783.1 hypothetical protein [Enterocloster clostridioformis]OXE69362.1 hypothetical protein ADH76_13585 [Enterocloster clostridioformis]QQR03182.1 hypothetical protein I5Q83_13740 [Enterocloster clostridioformis]
MRPVYVCQLTEEKQAEIRKMLEELILHGCCVEMSEVERYYGMSFEEAVQNGMDSKIVDLDYIMVFYAEEFRSGKEDERFRLVDAAVISSILREARKQDNVSDFIYPNGRCEQATVQEDDWER